ncbi:hypothetical protein OESDEN_03459 [Oesophagostomum dentatum]|uniref:Uncharacterized protein n=1 Tax=Oesophagostomum dentatum TaxID=61180 RepID=A0A0B1TH45_OESDE|nr:hypothetical protein OESDEN_03459 [Oesophagostomum dentatum]
MLGMMNSPSDAVEFYATNTNLKVGISEEDLKTFTEAKRRQTITYTKDGRRMIDGKIEDPESGAVMALWGNTLLRGAVRVHMRVQDPKDGEQSENCEDEEKKEGDEQQAKETQATYVQQIEIVEEPLLAKSKPEKEQPH